MVRSPCIVRASAERSVEQVAPMEASATMLAQAPATVWNLGLFRQRMRVSLFVGSFPWFYVGILGGGAVVSAVSLWREANRTKKAAEEVKQEKKEENPPEDKEEDDARAVAFKIVDYVPGAAAAVTAATLHPRHHPRAPQHPAFQVIYGVMVGGAVAASVCGITRAVVRVRNRRRRCTIGMEATR